MKNLLEYKTPQATYGGDVIGGSVVRGNAWGVFILTGYKAAQKGFKYANIPLIWCFQRRLKAVV
jgi:hypothetical protein